MTIALHWDEDVERWIMTVDDDPSESYTLSVPSYAQRPHDASDGLLVVTATLTLQYHNAYRLKSALEEREAVLIIDRLTSRPLLTRKATP